MTPTLIRRIVACAAVAVIVFTSSLTTIAADDVPSILPMVFRDTSANLAFAVQVVPGGADPGSYVLTVAGVGVVQGIVPLRPSGPQILHLQGTFPADFYPVGSDTATPTTVRFEGQLNTKQQSATINAWIDGSHYHLVTGAGSVSDATGVARMALDAIVSEDWAALYKLLSLEIRGDLSSAQFLQTMRNQAAPKLLGGSLSGSGQMQRSAGGYTYFVQPIIIKVLQSDGSVSAVNSSVYLVLEQGGWRFVSTD